MTKNAAWIAIIAASLAGSGCSELKAMTEAKPAHASAAGAQYCTSAGRDCNITVKVDAGQAPCKLTVDPDVNVVLHAHDVRIVWKLDAPGDYKFVYLRFKDEEPRYRMEFASRLTVPSKDQFHDKKMSAREVQVRDRNTKDGAWYYEIKVTNGANTCEVDPPMVNG